MRAITIPILCWVFSAGAVAEANPELFGQDDAASESQKAEKRKQAEKRDEQKQAEKRDEQKQAKKSESVTIGGRLFVRNTLSRTDLEAVSDEPWVEELEVASARITADYRRKKKLKVMIEVDFEGGEATLKDGYIRLRPRPGATLKAGRFKRPLSAISLESAWRLPLVERGILNQLEPDASTELPFGGRGDGVSFEYRLGSSPMKPTLITSLFLHQIADNVIDVSEHFPLDPYLRFELEPVAGLSVGASFAMVTHQKRKSDPDVIKHAPFGGLDVTLEQGPLKLWLEGYFGRSVVYDRTGVTGGNMYGARTIVALRLRDPVGWLRRIEPFATASLFDPDQDRSGDQGVQLGAGMVAQFNKAYRVQLEVEQTWIDDVDRLLMSDRTALYLQLGAAF